MISTTPKNGYPIIKLLLIAGAIVYAVKNKDEIKHGISDFLSKNQIAQETKSSLKWLYEELRPATEAEKSQRKAYAEEQQRRREYYKSMGINPHIEYVGPKDGKKWEEAKKDWQELKKLMSHGHE